MKHAALRACFPRAPGSGQAQVDALAENATEIVDRYGGKVAKTETWGLKSLAYQIDRNRKAHFVLLNIDAPAGGRRRARAPDRINEDVIRFLTVRVESTRKVRRR